MARPRLVGTTQVEPVLRGMGLDLDQGHAERAELRARGLGGR